MEPAVIVVSFFLLFIFRLIQSDFFFAEKQPVVESEKKELGLFSFQGSTQKT